VRLWTDPSAAAGTVDKSVSSPTPAHSSSALGEPKDGVIPAFHTLYDYDKGIS
jgi:hypothetical protein